MRLAPGLAACSSPHEQNNQASPCAQAKIALTHLFRRFDFRLAPGQVPYKIRSNITCSPLEAGPPGWPAVCLHLTSVSIACCMSAAL